jgi:hypothetical protein
MHGREQANASQDEAKVGHSGADQAVQEGLGPAGDDIVLRYPLH